MLQSSLIYLVAAPAAARGGISGGGVQRAWWRRAGAAWGRRAGTARGEAGRRRKEGGGRWEMNSGDGVYESQILEDAWSFVLPKDRWEIR